MAPMTLYSLAAVMLCVYSESDGFRTDRIDRHGVQPRYRYPELILYPRVGKRVQNQLRPHHVNRRRQFLNFLATSLKRTGGLRGVIHEIQDMSESKRSASTREQWNNLLSSLVINRYDQMELDRSARMMQKWSKARIGKRSYAYTVPAVDYTEEVDEALMTPRLYAGSKTVPIRWNRMPGMT